MKTEKYTEQKKRLPLSGRQIIGYLEDENIIVYQAFNPKIAKYAIDNQRFGGEHYSFNRMSWIKPGFLWMMYRAGWAQKEQQERILAIRLPLVHFKAILQQATLTSFDDRRFKTHAEWRTELLKTEVRLQWDPDHDPFGNKQERKAIQIGMKGKVLKSFCTEWIKGIEDITEFVQQTYQHIINRTIEPLNLPVEHVIDIDDDEINKRIGISKNLINEQETGNLVSAHWSKRI